jgi:hypothetical protein
LREGTPEQQPPQTPRVGLGGEGTPDLGTAPPNPPCGARGGGNRVEDV